MPTDFVHSYSRTAAKRHRCSVCSVVIPKGQKYWRKVGRTKNGFGCLYLCRSCAERFTIIEGKENA